MELNVVNIRDLKPGLKNLNLFFIVIEVGGYNILNLVSDSVHGSPIKIANSKYLFPLILLFIFEPASNRRTTK